MGVLKTNKLIFCSWCGKERKSVNHGLRSRGVIVLATKIQDTFNNPKGLQRKVMKKIVAMKTTETALAW